jgi:hypothetical protein
VHARPSTDVLEADSVPEDASAGLTARILDFIAAPTAADFDALALDVHRYQHAANTPYRRFVDRLGVTPAHWTEIPAVPASAFRDSVLACGPAARVYQSSGTTQGTERRARHHVVDVAVYRAAALAGFGRAVLPAGVRRPFVSAAPEHHTHRSSSLGEMVSWLRAEYAQDKRNELGGPEAPPSFLGAAGPDLAGLAAALDALDGRPILLVAVTSALLRLGDEARRAGRHWTLPPRSLVVDTGGCKGYDEDLPRGTILERYHETLGVVPADVVNEYGMTELCSQLYARATEPHRAPPWLRTLVCDPATGRELPLGEPGLLRHVDLANVHSVVAIQTDDVGRAVDGGIELLGRTADAPPRGCSLLVHA